jgi:hypothetical protein
MAGLLISFFCVFRMYIALHIACEAITLCMSHVNHFIQHSRFSHCGLCLYVAAAVGVNPLQPLRGMPSHVVWLVGTKSAVLERVNFSERVWGWSSGCLRVMLRRIKREDQFFLAVKVAHLLSAEQPQRAALFIRRLLVIWRCLEVQVTPLNQPLFQPA